MAKETKSTKSQSAPKKKAEKKTAPVQTGSAPLIDPAQSAAAAAALVGRKIAPTASTAGPKTESTSFKNLKDSFTKGNSQTIGGVLDKIAPNSQRWTGGPLGSAGKQVGHNQTVGADVARRNVPRRTNG